MLTAPFDRKHLHFISALILAASFLVGVVPRAARTAERQMSAARGAAHNAVGQVAPVAADVGQKAREAYGRLGVSFEENRGQVDEQVRFLARHGGASVFLTEDAAWFVLSAPPGAGAIAERTDRASEQGAAVIADELPVDALRQRTQREAGDEPLRQHAVRMQIEGARRQATIVGECELEGKVNYFRSNDPEKWLTDVLTYGAVQYRGIYEGVDLVYYSNEGDEMEYDFHVAPGADARQIALNFTGADSMEVEAQTGDLVIQTSAGELRQRRPVVYQELEGARQEIESRYEMRGRGRVGFAVEEYDRTRPLVIDPVLVYSTYLGGSDFDFGSDIAVDTDGNAYVTGFTHSPDFPTTTGAFDTSFNGTRDAFVTKLNATGAALVYSTYLGGSGGNLGIGIAVDAAGNAYVTGETDSPNFPTTTGAFDTSFNGTRDAFVTKLNATGAALVYSTYLGGSGGSSAGFDIAVDAAGNAYVTGETLSPNFPTTTGAFDTSFNGSGLSVSDAFVTKLNATGAALVYSTYLGSSDDDFGSGLAVDAAGNAYVTGNTLSPDFPTTTGAFDTSFNGSLDAFVAKLNATGAALVYSTYLGGSSSDSVFSIAVNVAGNAYVAGSTVSPNFPATPGAFDTSFNGVRDAFLTKIADTSAPTPTPTPTPTPSPALVAAGSALVTESCPPANGAADNGERFAISLAVMNGGKASTGNLIGTLAASSNVVAPGAAQNYGVIAPGQTVARTFAFTASGSPDQQITLTLELRDGMSTLVATLTYNMTLGGNSACATPRLLLMSSLARDQNNNLVMTIVIQNQGVTTATAVTLTQAILGSTSGAPLPQALGSLLPGQSVLTTVMFSGAGNPPGATRLLRLRGTFNGSSTFGTTGNVTPP